MSAFQRETPLSLNEHTFLRHSLSQGLRVDGRSPTDYRSVSLTFPAGSGCALVQLGATRVGAVTTADLVTPFQDRGNEGMLNLFVNFSPMASPTFEPGYQGEKGVEIARIVDRGIRESKAIDLESLCVLAGEKVWSIRVDIHVLDAGGNLLDAINLATVAALLHFRRPDVTVVGDRVTVHSVEDRQPIALALHHIPVACSFAFFEVVADPAAASLTPSGAAAATTSGGSAQTLWVVDPSHKEEQCADSGLTITLNVHGEVCCMQKSGGMGVELDTLLLATQVAQAKTTDLTLLIQQRLREDAAANNTGRQTKQPIFHLPARPIDAFGSIVTKPKGQHNVAGKPIEIDMNKKDESSEDEGKEEKEKEEDEEEEDDDEDDGEESEVDSDAEMRAQAEFNRVAEELKAGKKTSQGNSGGGRKK